MHPTIPLNRFLPYQNIPTNSSTALVCALFSPIIPTKSTKKVVKQKNIHHLFQVTLPPIAIIMELPSWFRSRTLTPTMAETAKVVQKTVGLFFFCNDFLLMFSVSLERLGVVGFCWDHLDVVFMFHPKLKVCMFFDECWWEKRSVGICWVLLEF